MEETGDVRFGRSAFGGFNRKDVMDYIDKLQRAAAAKGAEPQAAGEGVRECGALEEENRRLRGEIEHLREEIMQLRAQLKVEQTANELLGEKLHGAEPDAAAEADEAFSATAEPVTDGDAKTRSMRDVDEMVQKYFG